MHTFLYAGYLKVNIDREQHVVLSIHQCCEPLQTTGLSPLSNRNQRAKCSHELASGRVQSLPPVVPDFTMYPFSRFCLAISNAMKQEWLELDSVSCRGLL